MSTLLQSYEEEYRDVTKNINEGLTALRGCCKRNASGYTPPPSSGVGSRVQQMSSLSSLIAHVQQLLTSMDYECNVLPPAQREAVKERLADYRKNVAQLDESLSRARTEASAADRQDLIGNGGSKPRVGPDGRDLPGELDDETKKHRLQMMDNTQKVKDASNTLLKAERLVNDTETVGNEALGNLRNQTEQLQRINETTIAVDEEVSEARKILSGMQRVMIKHKLALIGVILVLVFLIIVAIYVAVNKGRSNAAVTPTYDPVDIITTQQP